MKAVRVFFHPLCPGEYLIAVIDVSGRLWMKARANFRITYNKKRQG